MNRYRFRAMGCQVVVAADGDVPIDTIRRLFAERERMFSRFLPQSEINSVNASAGRIVSLSPLFAATLEIALQVAEQTEGMVDPTIGSALEAAGYTRDFGELVPDDTPPGASVPCEWGSVLLVGTRLLVPSRIRIDLNGVVKALVVDDALELLSGLAFVSAGGDLAARGSITVALPDGQAVELRRGALATSSRSKRTWMRGGTQQHHLIDPRSGRPSDGLWQDVTACGANCLAADVAAKAAFLLGDRGPAWLDERRIPGRFIDRDGSVTTNHSWDRSLTEALACT